MIMGMWTAGLASGAALVARLRVVGPGYSWLTASVVVLFGALAAGAGGGTLGWVAVAAAVAAGAFARAPLAATTAFGTSAVLFAVAAWDEAPILGVVTGAVFLGGVTSEMILGHWYLVDPRLPRWALRLLTIVGGVGLAADVTYLAVRGGFDWAEAGAALGAAFVVLAGTTGVLLLGVWFALKEERYTGVMAATGLSYLATLTAIGAAVVGRMVAFGG